MRKKLGLSAEKKGNIYIKKKRSENNNFADEFWWSLNKDLQFSYNLAQYGVQ